MIPCSKDPWITLNFHAEQESVYRGIDTLKHSLQLERSRGRSSCALMAKMTVLTDMRAALIAGESMMPQRAKTDRQENQAMVVANRNSMASFFPKVEIH